MNMRVGFFGYVKGFRLNPLDVSGVIGVEMRQNDMVFARQSG